MENNVVNLKKLFFIPHLKTRIVCKKDFGEIFSELNEVVIRDTSLASVPGNVGRPVFVGSFVNYRFSLFPYHAPDVDKYMDVPSKQRGGRVHLMAPSFYGKFEVEPEQPVVLELSMQCSPLYIIFMLLTVLFLFFAIGNMSFPMIFGGVLFIVLTQMQYYQTARPALEHLLTIVGGEYVD